MFMIIFLSFSFVCRLSWVLIESFWVEWWRRIYQTSRMKIFCVRWWVIKVGKSFMIMQAFKLFAWAESLKSGKVVKSLKFEAWKVNASLKFFYRSSLSKSQKVFWNLETFKNKTFHLKFLIQNISIFNAKAFNLILVFTTNFSIDLRRVRQTS